jgi:RNA polymerase sigma-70 factor (ECF subfamily)
MQHGQREIRDQDLQCTRCPERLNLSGELAERLLGLMQCLPERQRQVIALVVLEEFSYRMVAETLDIPIGTVMSRLSRARRFLADQLRAASEPVNTGHSHLRRVK